MPRRRVAEPFAAILGRSVRRMRRTQRMTQDVLRDKSGISKGSISNIEHGKVVITVKTLCRLASALGVQPGELLPSEWGAAIAQSAGGEP